MERTYRDVYESLYREHWWWRAREALVLETARRLLPAAPGSRAILDVGCGNGLLFDALAGLGDVEGVEPAEDLVDPRGPHRRRIHVRQFDRGFAPPRRYGLVLMLDVLEHMDDPAGALNHAIGLLETGGLVIATVPAFRVLWTRHDDLNQHRTRFTRRSFRRLAQEAGLRVLEERYFYHWLFWAKLVARATERLTPGNAEPAIPRVPPAWLNRLLLLASRAEQRLARPVALPFGSSLLVVGTAAAGARGS
ncbi:class I SAM-dependent methyltransferase [Anaeromyxobacter sp. Red801]|uniref:class I SAM-dependent methyltransferase n=1 Tax=Anaeromyxobacter sp. Red801 TaxID=3411632 RepID=UPI003B9E819A